MTALSEPEKKVQWGGLIDAYLSAPDRAEQPDPLMEATIIKLRQLERTRTCPEFTEVFVTFELLEFHRLNSPLLDALFEGFYRIPVPAPNIPYHLPTLIQSGSVGKSFSDMCIHTFKCPEAVRYLLERENINHRALPFLSAFFESAIYNGTVESFALVLEKLDLRRCKFRLEVFLEKACVKSSLGIIKMLVGVIKEATYSYHTLQQCHPFQKALQRGDLEIIDFLYQEGFCSPGTNILAEAIRTGKIEILEWARDQVRRRAAINDPLPDGKNGGTALTDTQLQVNFNASLLTSCLVGSVEMTSYLLANGADPAYENSEPLLIAITVGNNSLVELLLAYGAVPDWHALIKAIDSQNLFLVRKFLAAGVNLELEGHQALRTAFEAGNSDIIELILNAYRGQPQRDI